MTWDEVQTTLMQHFSWTAEKAQDAVEFFNEGAPNPEPQECVDAYTQPPDNGTWVADFEQWLPGFIAAAKTQAEKNYNILTNNQAMIPGQQYVQDNGDGSFTIVVQFNDKLAAESGYNQVTYGGMPFVTGKRYVQEDEPGNVNSTYKVVVRYPLTY